MPTSKQLLVCVSQLLLPLFTNTLPGGLLCVRHKLFKRKLIFQLIYRVRLMATLEDNMGSLVVLFLQLPAGAGLMEYAEHAVHRDPQREKDPASYRCFHSFSYRWFCASTAQGPKDLLCCCCCCCSLKNIPPEFPMETCTLQIYTYDLTVNFHQDKN